MWPAHHAAREARRERPDGQGPPPVPTSDRDPSACAGARGGTRTAPRRPWRRLLRAHPREEAPAERGRRDAREAWRGRSRPSGREGSRRPRRRRADRGGLGRRPDPSVRGPQPRRRPRVVDRPHAVPRVLLDVLHPGHLRRCRAGPAPWVLDLLRRPVNARTRARVPTRAGAVRGGRGRPLHGGSQDAQERAVARSGQALGPPAGQVPRGFEDRRHGQHRGESASDVRDRRSRRRMLDRQR